VRVLVVEDQQLLAETLATGLRREGMAVDVVLDGLSATERIAVVSYDVIVLDRDLPGLHGDDICREVVAQGTATKVLMLTAAGDLADRVEGLTLGADDYLAKPFAFAELVARVRALARRTQAPVPPLLVTGDLIVDPAQRTARRGVRRLDLTPKELGMLEALLTAQGRVVSAEELLDRVWDERTDPFTNTVKVTMSRLRRKLGTPPLIETVANAGYRI
jgi:DNA-binding response OmpR family regulator